MKIYKEKKKKKIKKKKRKNSNVSLCGYHDVDDRNIMAQG